MILTTFAINNFTVFFVFLQYLTTEYMKFNDNKRKWKINFKKDPEIYLQGKQYLI